MERRLLIGGFLCVLLSNAPIYSQEVLVPPDAVLRFFRGTEEPPADWTAVDFDDSDWQVGRSGVGYENGNDALARSLIKTWLRDMQGSYLSAYVRIPFEVPDPGALAVAEFGIQYDDGYVAYLNGQEIARVGMNGRPPRYNEPANVGIENLPRVPEWTLLPRDALLQGTNVLAVQGHNATPRSSDFSIVPQMRYFTRFFCPSELSCTVRPGATALDVALRWKRRSDYDKVEFLRDGQIVGELGRPTPEIFVDRDVPAGEHVYEIVATSDGTRCSGDGVPSCEVTVVGGTWIEEAKLTGDRDFAIAIAPDGDRVITS